LYLFLFCQQPPFLQICFLPSQSRNTTTSLCLATNSRGCINSVNNSERDSGKYPCSTFSSESVKGFCFQSREKRREAL
jgi:hypothetical protein